MSENWSTHVTCELTTGWLASCHSLTRAEHWRDVYQYHPHVPSSSVRGSGSESLADALLNEIVIKLLLKIFLVVEVHA